MLSPYCPYGCTAVINTPGLRLNKSTDITREGVKIIVCPGCHKQILVTTKLIPDYTCEKVGFMLVLKNILAGFVEGIGK